MIKEDQINKQLNCHKINALLGEIPGQSVKELAIKLKVSRSSLSGYLQALEDLGYVNSRKVGPARVYYNKARERKNAIKVRS
jgi:DNA-binding transcriptional ArsR family regulator